MVILIELTLQSHQCPTCHQWTKKVHDLKERRKLRVPPVQH